MSFVTEDLHLTGGWCRIIVAFQEEDVFLLLTSPFNFLLIHSKQENVMSISIIIHDGKKKSAAWASGCFHLSSHRHLSIIIILKKWVILRTILFAKLNLQKEQSKPRV